VPAVLDVLLPALLAIRSNLWAALIMTEVSPLDATSPPGGVILAKPHENPLFS
jgi:hypothetical protein